MYPVHQSNFPYVIIMEFDGLVGQALQYRQYRGRIFTDQMT